MFAGKVIGQAVTRHFRGPVESGICFGIPRHHLKQNGRIVTNVHSHVGPQFYSVHLMPDV